MRHDKPLPAVPDAPINTSRKYDPNMVVVAFAQTGALQYQSLTADGLAIVEQYSRAGHTLESLCARLGLSEKGFLALRKRNPEVQEAWNLGRALLDNEITDVLVKQAREGNTTAAIFVAKGKLGWRDTGPSDASNNGPIVNITLTAPMSDEQFARMITVTPEAGE